MKKILIKIIEWYQKHISLWLQQKHIMCKFYPTCSEYTKQAIEKYGVLEIHRESYGPIAKQKIKQLQLF